MAGNTYSAALLTEKLEKAATTSLSECLAPLNAFTKGFSPDEYKPRAKCELKYVTATDAAVKNATDFEAGDSTVDNVQITVDQYTQAFHVSNDELNSGLRLTDLAEKNARAFGETLLDVVFALLKTDNFATAVTRTSSAFTYADMATAWGTLKKSSVKNAILDGEYMARLINSPVFYQPTDSEGGTGFAAFGWNEIYPVSRWSAAESATRGFFCAPQAIGLVAGLPQRGPSPTLETRLVTLPGLEFSVAFNTWFSLSTRSYWASYDAMFGCAALDKSAGYLLKDS
jgi:hypothetical protein